MYTKDDIFEENTRYGLGHLIVVFVTGALAGAVTALLTSPFTGKEGREHLRHLAQKGRSKLAKAPDAVRTAFLRGRRRGGEILEEGLSGLKEGIKERRF